MRKIKDRTIEYYSVYHKVDVEGKDTEDRGGNNGLYHYAMQVIERIK